MENKVKKIIEKISEKCPLDIKDIAISTALIAGLIAAYGIHEQINDQEVPPTQPVQESVVDSTDDIMIPTNGPQIVARQTLIESDGNVSKEVEYYTERIEAHAHTELDGSVTYFVPAGYTLKYTTDEYGNLVAYGERTYMKTAEEKTPVNDTETDIQEVEPNVYIDPVTGETTYYATNGVISGDQVTITTRRR